MIKRRLLRIRRFRIRKKCAEVVVVKLAENRMSPRRISVRVRNFLICAGNVVFEEERRYVPEDRNVGAARKEAAKSVFYFLAAAKKGSLRVQLHYKYDETRRGAGGGQKLAHSGGQDS